jgi:hypothetical protein
MASGLMPIGAEAVMGDCQREVKITNRDWSPETKTGRCPGTRQKNTTRGVWCKADHVRVKTWDRSSGLGRAIVCQMHACRLRGPHVRFGSFWQKQISIWPRPEGGREE